MARTFVMMAGAAALTGVLAALSAPAMAQYPDRPIKMIVPWAAGGDTDNIFRPFAPLLQKHLGQPVVIANVGGASGTVGAREAKNSPPTATRSTRCTTTSISTYYTGLTDINYSDFEPICLIAATPSVLTASPKTPWKNWQELIADAKKRPGQITVGATLGSTSHIFPATDREGGRHQVQVRVVRRPGPAHERDPRRPHRPHRLQPDAEGQGRRRPAQVPRDRHREARSRHARTCRRSRNSASTSSTRWCAACWCRRARRRRCAPSSSEACAQGGQGSGVRRGDEEAGHARRLPRRARTTPRSSTRSTTRTRPS